MNALDALSRTILLTRDYVAADVADRVIVDAFQNTIVRCIATEAFARSASGQSAIVAVASLVARMGIQVEVELSDVPIFGHQPPLVGSHLVSALIDLGGDLIPGTSITPPRVSTPDLVFVFGDAHSVRARRGTWYLSASDWAANITDVRQGAAYPTVDVLHPVGGLTTAALAAAEAYKHVVRQLPLADTYFNRYLAAAHTATWDFGDVLLPNDLDLGDLSIVSAGAITQAALFTLFRFANLRGTGVAFDDDRTEITNINRNVLSRRSDVAKLKVNVVASHAPSQIRLVPAPQRFDENCPRRAARVLVGVDHIPSRWVVQRINPSWLGVGGTTHFEVSCSAHMPDEPCAGCLHPYDDPADGPIPTVSFVSFWAGLSLAVRLIRNAVGADYGSAQQHLWVSPLRMESRSRVWSPVAARRDCPVRCLSSQQAA
jgi:molybdopterin/thiamine biosynthesis adenylyltransferase